MSEKIIVAGGRDFGNRQNAQGQLDEDWEKDCWHRVIYGTREQWAELEKRIYI